MTGIDKAGSAVISRRQAFRVGGALLMAKALSATAPLRFTRAWLGWLAPSPAGAQTANAGLSLAEFAPLVGSGFDIKVGRSRRVTTTLVEATRHLPHRLDRRGLTGESFSVLFASAAPRAFQHGTYTLEHPSMGAFPMFLVAVGNGTDNQRYEAVIDRRTLAG